MQPIDDANAKAATSIADPKGATAGGASATPIEAARFDILRSALYHDMRQRLLDRTNKLAQFLTVVLASGAIAAFGAQFPIIGQVAGVIVTVVGAAQLVWDFGGVARDHAELRKRYYMLLADVDGGETNAADIEQRLALIYADEPPINARANDAAHNVAGKSMYGDDYKRA